MLIALDNMYRMEGILKSGFCKKMKTFMKETVIFDGRNLFNIDDMTAKGFYYSSIGRQTVNSNQEE